MYEIENLENVLDEGEKKNEDDMEAYKISLIINESLKDMVYLKFLKKRMKSWIE